MDDASIEELEGDGTLERPIQLISMSSPSYDDSVPQITFTMDDCNTKSRTKNANGGDSMATWMVGFQTSTKLWKPQKGSSLATHTQMKSQPLDFDSED
jgi:hypothetical protein